MSGVELSGRTRNQIEVDFILYGPNGFHAFEIKRKERLSTQDFKGLNLFHKDYPMAQLHMLYGGNNTYYENDINVRSFKQGLLDLKRLLHTG